jgi:hypothetical protein
VCASVQMAATRYDHTRKKKNTTIFLGNLSVIMLGNLSHLLGNNVFLANMEVVLLL